MFWSAKQQLRSAHPEKRQKAIEKLKKERWNYNLISPLLQDVDDNVRITAADALGEIGMETTLDSLKTAMSDSSPMVKVHIIAALERINLEKSSSFIEQFLNADNENIKLKAAFALVHKGNRKATNILISALDTVNKEQCLEILALLGETKDPNAIAKLVLLTKDPDSEIYEKACYELVRIDWSPILNEVNMHNDEYAHSIRQIIDIILENVKRKEKNSYHALAIALGKIADPRAVDILIGYIKDSNEHNKLPFIFALLRIGDPKAIESVLLTINHDYEILSVLSTYCLMWLEESWEKEPTGIKTYMSDIPYSRISAILSIIHIDRKLKELGFGIYSTKSFDSITNDIVYTNIIYAYKCYRVALYILMKTLKNDYYIVRKAIKELHINSANDIDEQKLLRELGSFINLNWLLNNLLNSSIIEYRREAAFLLTAIGPIPEHKEPLSIASVDKDAFVQMCMEVLFPKYNKLFVEDIVVNLLKKRESKPLFHIAMYGDRPLSAKMGEDESILIFTDNEKGNRFIHGYQQYYKTEQSLSILPLGSLGDVWIFLNSRSKDPNYTLPLGLIIDFDYSGQPSMVYNIQQLNSIGKQGLEKGLNILLNQNPK